MCAILPAPPYMLHERPTPSHGGNGSPTFRQIPFIRVYNRVESGISVRKQLCKYLKASSATQQMVSQMHLQQACTCLNLIQSQEISQTSFDTFFQHMKDYNERIGTKHAQASQAFQEMSRIFQKAKDLKKWVRGTYQTVQKCVQEISSLEKRIEKAHLRLDRAQDEVRVKTQVMDANEKMWQIQGNNPEVFRAYQVSQARHTAAVQEKAQAQESFVELKSQLFSVIERRDQLIEEAAEHAQSVEEDRLDTVLIVLKQYLETKTCILHVEIEALAGMQKLLQDMERKSVIQQFTVDQMQPTLSHRQAKALALSEWHSQQKIETMDCLNMSPKQLKSSNIRTNDVEIAKDFVLSCFLEPERSIMRKPVSSRHRSRFYEKSASDLYRLEIIRKVCVQCLHHQRAHGLELSDSGFSQLSTALTYILDACHEQKDYTVALSVMNMAQTFYKNSKDQKYIPIQGHIMYSSPLYWNEALRISISQELSKQPTSEPWFTLSEQGRTRLVLCIHEIAFHQIRSFIFHLFAFQFSVKQVQQYVQQAVFAYELGEEQKISLFSSMQELKKLDRKREYIDHDRRAIRLTCYALTETRTVNSERQKRNSNRAIKLKDEAWDQLFGAKSDEMEQAAEPKSQEIVSRKKRIDRAKSETDIASRNKSGEIISLATRLRQQRERIKDRSSNVSGADVASLRARFEKNE